ncbi:hypothetical protein [Mycobacteroides abscessus]|uniref:Uncharacterized protein n=1 Tax=Mycobacteroides abscessus subsp. massiliense TaxID=1962118 RepID=A0A1U1B2D5_9MYCO|nr:hypothetical protein [Mycobacteroides abscessus]SKM34489.1 Uncharacterised protein [Mycobacteroides abscessus subsp. massiliense]SKT38732.1 Uncharacterised protein [Mycobacteroides abscessus subsp. massiliense]SKT85133.1 Uncharacterised protein [Mycobacteroides abscessus subsp. massiliense]SKX26667.1 Uncharacterised protein [Mycobacteroides abscessus subsp. massiliense]
MTASPPLVPTAPPLHGVAPAGLLAPQAPAPTGGTSTLSTDEIVAFIEASADPAAELAHLVLQVSMRAATATRQGQILSSVNSRCAKALKAVRVALLTAVANTPGVYDGFTVTQKAGARSVKYDLFEERYPDVYAELVSVAAPTLNLSYT